MQRRMTNHHHLLRFRIHNIALSRQLLTSKHPSRQRVYRVIRRRSRWLSDGRNILQARNLPCLIPSNDQRILAQIQNNLAMIHPSRPHKLFTHRLWIQRKLLAHQRRFQGNIQLGDPQF